MIDSCWSFYSYSSAPALSHNQNQFIYGENELLELYSHTYLFNVLSQEHKINTTEAQLGQNQEEIHQVPGKDIDLSEND